MAGASALIDGSYRVSLRQNGGRKLPIMEIKNPILLTRNGVFM